MKKTYQVEARLLARGRRTPCCGRPVKLPELVPVEKRCTGIGCHRKWIVTFERADAASALVGTEVWRAVWTEHE